VAGSVERTRAATPGDPRAASVDALATASTGTTRVGVAPAASAAGVAPPPPSPRCHPAPAGGGARRLRRWRTRIRVRRAGASATSGRRLEVRSDRRAGGDAPPGDAPRGSTTELPVAGPRARRCGRPSPPEWGGRRRALPRRPLLHDRRGSRRSRARGLEGRSGRRVRGPLRAALARGRRRGPPYPTRIRPSGRGPRGPRGLSETPIARGTLGHLEVGSSGRCGVSECRPSVSLPSPRAGRPWFA
jgi:hypothetical protein